MERSERSTRWERENWARKKRLTQTETDKNNRQHRHKLTHIHSYEYTAPSCITKPFMMELICAHTFRFHIFFIFIIIIIIVVGQRKKKSLNCKINDRLARFLPGGAWEGTMNEFHVYRKQNRPIYFIASCETQRISHFNFSCSIPFFVLLGMNQ